MSAKTLTGFVRAVRRRLWLQSLLQQARIAVWVGSITLLLITAISAWLITVPTSTTVALSLTATFLALLPAAFQRPNISASAVRADRHFGGHSLLTTALEANGAETSPAGRVVVARAATAAAAWSNRIGSIWSAPPATPFALAMIPIFAAVMLLIMTSTPMLSATPNDSIVANESVLQADDDVQALRKTLAADTGDESGQDVSQQSRQKSADALSTADAAPTSTTSEELADVGDTTLPGFAAVGQDGGVEAGSARRSPYASAATSESASFESREYEQIKRSGDFEAGRGGTSADFAETTLSAAIADGLIKPAAAPPDAGSWSALTSAELAYAKSYLDRKAATDD